MSFSSGSVVKNPLQCSRFGDPCFIPGSGKSTGQEMAIHSRNLAWKIPWTEEPGGLQTMVSQRVRHDWLNS